MRLLINPTIKLATVKDGYPCRDFQGLSNIYMWLFIETIPLYKISLQAPESQCPRGPALECRSAQGLSKQAFIADGWKLCSLICGILGETQRRALLSPIQIKRVSCHSPTQTDTTELPAAVKVLSADKTPTHLQGVFAPSITSRAVHHSHLSAVSTQSPTHALAPLFCFSPTSFLCL